MLQLLDNVIDCLKRGRQSLALPRKKSLEELIKKSQFGKCLCLVVFNLSITYASKQILFTASIIEVLCNYIFKHIHI